MEFDENNGFAGGESFHRGAIFMCNRQAKKECFRRKLFGLPPSKEGIVKSIRPGVILFLFEYEERKLYGVFQATSDGALNILPHAFRSSGKNPSAQVHFKTLWNCCPLKENEFRGAIRGNYYTPRKFNLFLSPEQVFNLLKLFARRKISTSNRLRPASSSDAEIDFEIDQRQQQSLHDESLYGPIPDSSYRESALDSDDYFARNEVLSYHNTDNFPNLNSTYSEYPVCLSPRKNVPLRHEVLPKFQPSQGFHMGGGFQHEELPSSVRVDIPLQDLANIPKNNTRIEALSQDKLYRSQLDAGTIVSAGYLPIDHSSSVEVYKGWTICNQGLTNPLMSSSTICGNAGISGNFHGEGVFDPYILPVSNWPLKLESNIGMQKVGKTKAKIIAGLPHPYPSEFLQSGGGSSPLQSLDYDPLNLPETECDDDILVSSHSQMNLWDKQFCYTAEYEDCHNDIEWEMACKSCFGKCHTNYCKKGRKGQRNSVFARISNAPKVDEHDLDDDSSLEQVQIWLSKQNDWRPKPFRKSSVATVKKQKCSSAGCEKRKCSSVHEKETCSNIAAYSKLCLIDHVQDHVHTTIKVQPGPDLSIRTDGLSYNGDTIEVFSRCEFVNFKRRSVVRKASTGAEMAASVGDISKSFSGKLKRRKLVRPTFSNSFVENSSCGQNEHRNGQEGVQDSSLDGEVSVELGTQSVPMGNYASQDDAKEHTVGARIVENYTSGQGEVSAELGSRTVPIGGHSGQDDVKNDIVCTRIADVIIKTSAKASVQMSLEYASESEVGLPEALVVDGVLTFPSQNIEERIVGLGGNNCCREKSMEDSKRSSENEGILAGSSNSENPVGIQMVSLSDYSCQGQEASEGPTNNLGVIASATESFVQAKDGYRENQISPIASHQSLPLNENLQDLREICSGGVGCSVSVPFENNNFSGSSENLIAVSCSLEVHASGKEPKGEDAAHCIIPVAMAPQDPVRAKLTTDNAITVKPCTSAEGSTIAYDDAIVRLVLENADISIGDNEAAFTGLGPVCGL